MKKYSQIQISTDLNKNFNYKRVSTSKCFLLEELD